MTARSRRSLEEIVRRYDRVARLYASLEPLYLIFPRARRKAVRALRLEPGDTVLEVGAGSGRNLPYLIDAVGPTGSVIAVDASTGMLAEAQKLVREEGWRNVELVHRDATSLELDTDLGGVLFSLSYSVCRNRGRRWPWPGTGSVRAAGSSSWTSG